MTDPTEPQASPAKPSVPNADDYGDFYLDTCGNIGCDEGWVANCFDGFCVNAEDGCDLCLRRCDWCNPKERNP
jgi:hypothetical protein